MRKLSKLDEISFAWGFVYWRKPALFWEYIWQITGWKFCYEKP